jgi:ureidoglycolate hydrolase
MEALRAIRLTPEAYRKYGDVISAREDVVPTKANLGTADRYNWLHRPQNLRPESAQANVCVFHCQPYLGNPFRVELLEHHPDSTQMFIPMGTASRYLVVVALGGTEPDLSTLQAFVAAKDQGITYHPGVWHHPLIALDQVTDFACWVYEDKTARDCVIRKVYPALSISF